MGEGSKFSWMGFIAGGIFTLVVLFIGIFFEPMKTWVDSKFWSPEIKIEFEQKPPYFYGTTWGVKKVDKPVFGVPFSHEEIYKVYFCRFAIENASRYKTVHGCRVKLMGIRHVDEAGKEVRDDRFEPVDLDLSGNAPVDLQPKARIFAYLGKVSDVDYQKRYEIQLSGAADQPQLRLLFLGDVPQWMPSHLVPGRHRLMVAAFFDDRGPVYQTFEVVWSGVWQEDEALMKNELRVRKIDESIPFD